MGIYLLDAIIIFFAGLFLTMQQGQPKRKITFLVISSLFLVITLGLRGMYVGEDTHTYIKIANSVENLSWSELFAGFPRSSYGTVYYADGSYYKETIETGYLILNKIIMSIFHEPIYVQLIIATAICVGFAKFIYDNSQNVFLSLWVFLCESMYMSAFNIQRQVLAIAIGVQAYKQLKDKNYTKAIVYIIMASMFHTSALVLLILIPLSLVKKYNVGIKICIMGMGVLVFSLSLISKIIAIILPRYAIYIQTSFWVGSIGGIIIIWLIEIVIFTIMYFAEVSDYQDYMCLVCVPIYIGLELIGMQFTAIARVALFFRVFMLLLFPAFLKYIHSKKLRLIYFFGLMAINFLQFYSAISSPTRLYSFYIK